jgi:hypothetical protein
LALAALPVTVVDKTVYASAIQEAKKLIGRRDPEKIIAPEYRLLAESTMNDLLARILDAHGVLKRWETLNKVSATIVSGDCLLPMKGLEADPTPLCTHMIVQHI